MIQGYVERHDDLAVVRGRMWYTEQATRRFGQVTPLLVRYDDFTIDIAEINSYAPPPNPATCARTRPDGGAKTSSNRAAT